MKEGQRKRGQFWTPLWLAEGMVAYVIRAGVSRVFDPAVGTGVFFEAVRRVGQEYGLAVKAEGTEIDSAILSQGVGLHLEEPELERIQVRDFLRPVMSEQYLGIVGNPPYVRHHHLEKGYKRHLQEMVAGVIGQPLDGRAGLHLYFLVAALGMLGTGGRLAFILPADICEGKFAPSLWEWVTQHYALDAVLSFLPESTPFRGIDINPLVFFLRRGQRQDAFYWATYRDKAGSSAVKQWVESGFCETDERILSVEQRHLGAALQTGLTRSPVLLVSGEYTLGNFVRVMRGIATGCNQFFFLTLQQLERLGIEVRYCIRAVGRTKDVIGDVINEDTLNGLESRCRPTYLLYLTGDDDNFPRAVRAYLEEGMRMGLPQRPLISQRRPWYKMEMRVPPPFLFSYLGRRHNRFIRNEARVVPLTSFLCVYPKKPEFREPLWQILQREDTIANLVQVSKGYGNGAIKVEPRLLEQLPLSKSAITTFESQRQNH